MVKVNVSEAKAHLEHYMELAASGERVVLCQRNVKEMELRPVSALREDAGHSSIGAAKGRSYYMADDFDAPLPEIEEALDRELSL